MLGLSLGACSPASETAVPTADAHTPTATDEPPATATPEPTQTPEPIAEVDAACIACHSNAETLQALAVDEGPVESLSSGEG
jgi:hypothetical protein